MPSAATLTKSRKTTAGLMPIQSLVQPKLTIIRNEINAIAYEREEVVWAILVALIARQHVLMVGPPGTAKSLVARMLAKRVLGKYFETQFSETSTPDEVFGSPDIPALVEHGKTRRVVDSMLPEADLAFLDELFNANGPILHGLQSILNERIYHNGIEVINCPLRTVLAGTNKLNLEADQQALWDRMHIRFQVNNIADRDNLAAMITDSLARQLTTYAAPVGVMVKLDELDAAHDEAVTMPIPQETVETFLDLLAALRRQGVEISDRRKADGYKAVTANAWLAGHDRVRVGDLGILQHMFWTAPEDSIKVRNIILDFCNPGEKAALTLLDDLAEVDKKYTEVLKLDKAKRNAAAIDLFKKTGKIITEAQPLREKALAGGASTIRIDDLIRQSEALKVRIGTETFGLEPSQIAGLKDISR